jgi:uncharacterized protein involved in exopolysaccharide biosynthesis
MPNIYRTTTTLAPATEKKSGLGGLGSQLGGLASLAGVNLSGSSAVDKTDLAIELLKSKAFLAHFIESQNMLLPLLAAKNWDLNSGRYIYDADIYDEQNKKWVRDAIAPRKVEPTSFEAAIKFAEILEINKDKTTSMVKVTFEHFSPVDVQKWTLRLVDAVNNEIRTRDTQEAKSSLVYLNKQLQESQVSEIRSSLVQLIEDQTKTLMLANIRDEYVFKVVDPAFVPEEKFKPRRSLVVLMSLFGVGIILMLIAYVRVVVSQRKS